MCNIVEQKDYIVGIDFGHGETSAWYIKINAQLNGDEEGALRIRSGAHAFERVCPSEVYVKDGKYSLVQIVGSLIRHRFKGVPSALNDDQRESFKNYIRLIFEAIIERNDFLTIDRTTGESNFHLCVACPTRWNDKNRTEYLAFITDALQEFHIRPLWIINESDAAYFSISSMAKKECTLVIDYGSSTIDYTLMKDGKKISEDEWSNPQLGASLYETGILNHFKKEHPEEYRKGIKDQIEECRKIRLYQYSNNNGCEIVNYLINDLREAKESVFVHGKWPVLDKINFSMFNRCGGYGSGFSDSPDIKISGDLSKMSELQEYQNSVKQDFVKLKGEIEKKLCQIQKKEYGEIPYQLNRIILSGGACQMTWVREMVQQVFGADVEIKEDNDPAYVVCKGIAQYAKAQLEAWGEIEVELQRFDYKGIYNKADRDATADSIKAFSQQLKNNITNNNTVTGKTIRNCFINYISGLDAANPVYCQKFTCTIRKHLGDKVHGIINDVLTKKFGRGLDRDDVDITLTPIMIPWDPNAFTVGSPYYKIISNCIEQTAFSESIVYFSFTWDNVRDKTTTNTLVEGTLKRIMNHFRNNPDSICYSPEQALTDIANMLYSETKKIAWTIFIEKQLFITTFTE